MNPKTLLTIDGLIGDEEYIKSGNFIDNSAKTVYLDSQYVDRYNEVTIINDGGYKIDLQNSWTDKKINYIVTDNATISVDGFTDSLNLNLLDKEKEKLTYQGISNNTDNILQLSNGKEITLQGTVTNSTNLNLNTDTVPSIGLSLSKDAQGNYLISSAEDLKTLATYVNKGNNCKNLSFKLTNDIDLSSIANWTPIGTSNIAFKGTFDGDDKTISGLNINSSNNYAGLFGHLGKDGTVNNVKLAAVNITANKYVGGIVGYNDCGDINNSSVSGTVSSNGGSRIGGLVGYNHGGTISYSSFSGTVNSNGGNYVGGIVGQTEKIMFEGNIDSCTTTATVTGYKYVGGIIGSNDGIVKNCTVNGTVTGDKYAGGIVGYNQTYSRDDDTGGGEISGNIMVAEVSKTNIAGVLVGYLYDGTITNNKYFVSTNIDTSSDTIGEKTSSTNITIKDNAQICKLIFADGITITGEGLITVDGVNYAPVGTTINFAAKTGYILNKSSIESVMVPDTYNVFYMDELATATSTEAWGGLNGANGSAEKPYLISDAAGLKALADFVNKGNDCKGLTFKLTDNIDMKDVEDFAPIGCLDSTKNIHYSFNGTFDGDNKTISNLTISSDLKISSGDKKAVGLFGYVSGATIKNVTLNTVNVTLTNTTAPTQVGALVGYNYGGNITNNTIIDSNVQGADNVGGLVGCNYNSGKVTGNKVIATVTGSSGGNIGAVVGENNNGSVTGNFYRNDVDAVGNNQSTASNNLPIYQLTLPEGVTAQGTIVTIDDTTYYSGNVTLQIGTGAALGNVKDIDNVAANSSGQVTFNIASDTEITADNIFYAVTAKGATISGNSITVDEQNYYRGAVTATAKTGYIVESSTVTVDKPTNITATLDTTKHYAFSDGNGYTLATAANTKGYPDLVQVYQLTLPEGVKAQGTIVTIDDTTYYSGNVTLQIGTGAALGNVKDIDNVAANSSGQVTFNIASDTEITADNIFYAVTAKGATISGGNSITVAEQNYYRGAVTATAKTGYIVDSTVTVDKPTNITATLDTTKHYAFSDGNGYTLATAANTKGYPDLVQVYQLTLPDNVTAQGTIVTIEPAEGYTLDNIKVNDTASDETFTVDGNTNITADVTAIVAEDLFNAAGTAVVVRSTSGDFSANSTLYTITASQENSTLIANAKANTIILSGGGTNILTGGKGNDTFKFEAGGGIVTDYGIGATKGGDGKALPTASGTDIVKVDGKVTGIYFDRDASSKKLPTFTATIVYTDDNDADQIVVLKDIAKKPTKTGSSPIYQTNDVAAATLKIWDTSNTKQAVLSSTKLKKLFHDDSDDAFTGIIKEKTDYLVDISKGITPATNPFEVTSSSGDDNKDD